MEDFPPNSRKKAPPQKKVEKVVSSEATRRKPPLGKQFKTTFLAGDARSAMSYVTFYVIIPAVKDLIAEAATSGIERLIFGESRGGRRRSSMGAPPSGPKGHIDYRNPHPGMSSGPRTVSRQSRARGEFDEIVLSSRTEADDVIERLFDLISQYDVATLADLYTLTGFSSNHTDQKWGWTDMRGATVERLRNGGYLLDLPELEVID